MSVVGQFEQQLSFSFGKIHNSNSLNVFFKSLLFSRCQPAKHLGSLGGSAECDLTALRGVKSSCRCQFSQGGDRNPDSLHVSFKSLMFSRCQPAKHLGLSGRVGGG